jgi:hypothetical protein
MIKWFMSNDEAITARNALAARAADLQHIVIEHAGVPPLCAEELKKIKELIRQLNVLIGE